MKWIEETIQDYLEKSPGFNHIEEASSKEQDSFLFSSQFLLILILLLIVLLCIILILIILCFFKKRKYSSYAFSRPSDQFKDAFALEDEFVFHKAEPQHRGELRSARYSSVIHPLSNFMEEKQDHNTNYYNSLQMKTFKSDKSVSSLR